MYFQFTSCIYGVYNIIYNIIIFTPYNIICFLSINNPLHSRKLFSSIAVPFFYHTYVWWQAAVVRHYGILFFFSWNDLIVNYLISKNFVGKKWQIYRQVTKIITDEKVMLMKNITDKIRTDKVLKMKFLSLIWFHIVIRCLFITQLTI